jgi:hypothetical protein
MSLLLLPDELVALTGYRQKSKQAAWLKSNKMQFKLGRDGRPRVDRVHYQARMGGAPRIVVDGPNWAALGPNWVALEPTP